MIKKVLLDLFKGNEQINVVEKLKKFSEIIH